MIEYQGIRYGGADPRYVNATGDTMTGRLKIQSDDGLWVGADDDLKIGISGANITIANVTQDGDIIFQVNDNGVTVSLLTLDGDVSTAIVAGPNFPPLRGHRTGLTSDALASGISVCATKTTNMADGFGAGVAFEIEDDAGTKNLVGVIGITRSGGDNHGQITFQPSLTGTPTTRGSIGPNGNWTIGPTNNVNGLTFGSLGTASIGIDFSSSGLSGSTDYPIYLDVNNHWAADGRWKGHIRWQLVHSGTNSTPEAYIDAYNDQYNYGSLLFFRKSHNDSEGSLTPTIDTTILGSIVFDGVDSGSAFDRGAIIRAIQDGAAGTTVPTKITFTTYDDSGNYTIGLQIEKDGDLTLAKTSGTSVISTGSTAGVARAVHFDIPVAAGGAANAALDFQLQIDGTLEAGLLAETDGSGSYQDAVFMIPDYSGDYDADWSGLTPPAPASLAGGCSFVAYNSNGAGSYRLYYYLNSGWHYVALT